MLIEVLIFTISLGNCPVGKRLSFFWGDDDGGGGNEVNCLGDICIRRSYLGIDGFEIPQFKCYPRQILKEMKRKHKFELRHCSKTQSFKTSCKFAEIIVSRDFNPLTTNVPII